MASDRLRIQLHQRQKICGDTAATPEELDAIPDFGRIVTAGSTTVPALQVQSHDAGAAKFEPSR
jgi:hypothetical protein